MCVHHTEDETMKMRYIGGKRKQKMFRALKIFVKESGFVIAAWMFLTCLARLSHAAPFRGGDGVQVVGVRELEPIPTSKENTGFISGFVSSLSMIIVSELGDKTFFIAAIMAMRHPRFIVFCGAMSALAFMTVFSALFGYLTTFIPRVYTYYVSTALFAIFGLKMIYDGILMSDDEGAEELEEVQMTLREDDENTPLTATSSNESLTSPTKNKLQLTLRRILFTCFSKVYIQALTLTFLAEWGDRSQLATVVLAARENILGICIGGVLGHSLCTGLAVIGGRMIAQKISVKTVTIVGGIVFLLFAVVSLFLSPN